jgi:hypothetical protein
MGIVISKGEFFWDDDVPWVDRYISDSTNLNNIYRLYYEDEVVQLELSQDRPEFNEPIYDIFSSDIYIIEIFNGQITYFKGTGGSGINCDICIAVSTLQTTVSQLDQKINQILQNQNANSISLSTGWKLIH